MEWIRQTSGLTRFVLLGVLVLIGGWLLKPGTGEAPPTSPKAALTIEWVTPVAAELPITLAANGSVSAWQEAVISAELSGIRLVEIQAQVGDRVKKGQVLALFDRERVASDLENSQAVLAEAEATLQEARDNARRVRQIIDEGALSALQAGQYLTGEKTAEARMRAARAQVEIQKLRMRHTQVLANDDGIVTARSAVLGGVTVEGQELFRLIRQQRLEWRAEVTATELPKIRIGTKVNVRVPDVGTLPGVVRMVGPGLDPASRFGIIYVDLPGAADRGFKAGMYAHGDFEVGISEGLTIPRTAITLRDGFSYAFKVVDAKEDFARVEEVKLELGRSVGESIEILQGIAPGDHIVRAGSAFLADGDRVRIAP
jgi:RND family efflux transporter MFP subunit